MLILLPVFAFFLIFLAISGKFKGLLWRERLLVSIVLFSLLLVVITEVLSFFHLLTPEAIGFCWSFMTLATAFSVKKSFKEVNILPNLGNLTILWEKNTDAKISIIGLLIVAVSTFILSLTSAPNNIDAASLWLARPMHWLQNASLAYYPTHITWQLYQPPLASFAFLHALALAGSDIYSNLVQWLFAIGSFISVTLIAYRLRADLKTQILAGFIALSVPIGILQASSTGEDYILAFFFGTFVYFGIAFFKTERNIFLFVSAISLGLAFLTKHTAYVYFLPFMLWFFAGYLLRFGYRKAVFYVLATLVIAFSVNTGFFWRNYTFSGLPIFSLRDDYVNRPVGPKSFVLGSVKNISVHLSTPIKPINKIVYDSVGKLHQFAGVSLDSPNFNWLGREFVIFKISANEYKAPNTIHFLLLILCVILLMKKKGYRDLKYFLLASFFAFFLFSAVFRWQSSSSRFHLPLFVLWSVPIAISLGKLKPLAVNLLLVVILSTSFYFVLFNIAKPVISNEPFFQKSREQQYFILRPQLYEPYRQIAQLIRDNNYKNVGLFLEEQSFDFEYPLWAIIGHERLGVRIEHVDVQNPTKELSDGFAPDVVVFLKQNRSLAQKYIDLKIPVVGIE